MVTTRAFSKIKKKLDTLYNALTEKYQVIILQLINPNGSHIFIDRCLIYSELKANGKLFSVAFSLPEEAANKNFPKQILKQITETIESEGK